MGGEGGRRDESAVATSQASDELDRVLRTTNPRGWVAVAATAAVIAIVIVWAFVATIPSVARAPGVLVVPAHKIHVTAPAAGTVLAINALPGQALAVGDPLLVLKTRGARGEEVVVRATGAGELDQVRVVQGDVIDADTVVAAISPWAGRQSPVVVCLVAASQAGTFPVGSGVTVEWAETSQTQPGTVRSVAGDPADEVELAELFGGAEEAKQQLAAFGGVPVPVTVQLDAPSGGTTSTRGNLIPAGARVTVTRVVSSRHPIELLFS